LANAIVHQNHLGVRVVQAHQQLAIFGVIPQQRGLERPVEAPRRPFASLATRNKDGLPLGLNSIVLHHF
jgi:hypothetical protein